eukprot:9851508-Alexandrium_andersonii.AAC.1
MPCQQCHMLCAACQQCHDRLAMSTVSGQQCHAATAMYVQSSCRVSGQQCHAAIAMYGRLWMCADSVLSESSDGLGHGGAVGACWGMLGH